MADEIVGHMSEKVVIPPPQDITLTPRRKPTVPPEEYVPFQPDDDLVTSNGVVLGTRLCPYVRTKRNKQAIVVMARKNTGHDCLAHVDLAIIEELDSPYAVVQLSRRRP